LYQSQYQSESALGPRHLIPGNCSDCSTNLYCFGSGAGTKKPTMEFGSSF